jgi:hypothetical protein
MTLIRPSLVCALAAISAAVMLGCGRPAEDGGEPAQDLEAESRNIGDRYVRGVLGAGNQAQGTVGVTSVNKAIEMYHLQHNKNPPSLDALVSEGFLPQKPKAPPGKKFEYDATAGTARLVDG